MSSPAVSNLLLLAKNLAFTLVVPGTVTVLLPLAILRRRAEPIVRWDAASLAALLVIAAGAAIYLRCLWDFAAAGRGTPAPIDPPRELVVQGLYRCVRNPMYVGIVLILLGEAALFRSAALIAYALAFLAAFQLVVVLYEEPYLRRRFGTAYERYLGTVGRWIPRRRRRSSSLSGER